MTGKLYDALIAKIVGIHPSPYPYANMDDLSGPHNMETQNVILDGWETGLSSLLAIYPEEVERLSLIGAGFRKEGYTIRVDTKSYAGTDTNRYPFYHFLETGCDHRPKRARFFSILQLRQ